MEKDEMITLSEASRQTGVSVATLRRAAAMQTLRATKAGPRAWVTTLRAVREWLDTPEYHRKAPKKYR